MTSRLLTEEQLKRVSPGDGTLSPDEESVFRLVLVLIDTESVAKNEIFSVERIASLLAWPVPRAVAAMQGLVEVGLMGRSDAQSFALQERRRREGEPSKEKLN